jgi:hypothetical protein
MPMYVAVDDVQVGSAYAACGDFDEQIRAARVGDHPFNLAQRLAGAVEQHGAAANQSAGLACASIVRVPG